MKHFRFTRLLPWLVISLCPPLLGHCGGALEHGTETGNPPVVEQQKLHVVLHDDGVEVVGEAGAVSPGASVTVTNTRSGEHSEAIARGDGSVSVSLSGSLADEYEVTVSSGGGWRSVRLTASSSDAPSSTNIDGNADLSDAELASASCDALEGAREQRVSAAYDSAENRCSADEDCAYHEWDSGACVDVDCARSILSSDSVSRVRDQLAVNLEPLCTEMNSRCPLHAASNCAPITALPQCLNGSCQALDLSSSSCEDLSNTAAARFNALLASAHRECTQDADCILYEQHLSCAFTCPGRPTPVAASAEPALEKGLAHIEGYCDVFRGRRTCAGPFPLPCPAPLPEPRAVCLFPSQGATPGQCGLTYAQP